MLCNEEVQNSYVGQKLAIRKLKTQNFKSKRLASRSIDLDMLLVTNVLEMPKIVSLKEPLTTTFSVLLLKNEEKAC